ncbi:retrotransposon hot spot (RHS) protein, putative, partial [Trypanosoma cruzi marinkellei]
MGICCGNFLQRDDTSSTGSGTEEWWLRASTWDLNGGCNKKGSVTAHFSTVRIAEVFHEACVLLLF